MVNLNRKPIETNEDEVIVNGWRYQRKIDALQTNTAISPKDYVLSFMGDEANFALSIEQKLNGLAFGPMVRESFKLGLPLARARDFMPFHRDVNLALQRKGVLYDASGNLIEKERLIKVGNAVNNAWVYLNDAYEKSNPEDKGFLGLDLVHVVGFDGEKPILKIQPLKECVVDCWADTEYINEQGYYTKKAPVQKPEQGRVVYTYEPVADCVAWLVAYSDRAYLYCGRSPSYAGAALGGILRADSESAILSNLNSSNSNQGTAPKIPGGSK